MHGLEIPPDLVVALVAAFMMVATAYSSAGFGGGSTYSALLAQAGLSPSAIPLVSLPCNMVVSGAGFVRFLRRGHVPVRELAMVSAVSMPASFVGGFIPVASELFSAVLGSVLLVAGLSSLYRLGKEQPWRPPLAIRPRGSASRAGLPIRARSLLGLGGAIGFVSGIAGIGGGILLSPALLTRRDANPQTVAAMASGFIFLNSIAGLAGQILKSGLPALRDLILLGSLVSAVFLGGFIGTSVALGRSRELVIRSGTALLVTLVGGRLVFLV